MNKYHELKQKLQKEISDFPLFWAFTKKSLSKGMGKLGLKFGEENLLCAIGGGGYMKKSDYPAFKELLNNHNKEMKEAMENDEFLLYAFNYELGNHEYIVTGDVTDTLNALDLTYQEVNENERMKTILKQAIKEYEDWQEK